MDNVSVQQHDHDDDSTTTDTTTTTTRSRAAILKLLHELSTLRGNDVVLNMPAHRQDEWRKLVTCLENLTAKRFEKVQVSARSNEPNRPVTSSKDAIPSTSGVSRDATITNTIWLAIEKVSGIII